jgi:AcrR family transcriptional regulator
MVKKQLIMEKALELFAKQGFEATSVQQITEHCGISKGAFYLSFKSKDELIISLIDHFMNQIVSDIDYLVRTTKSERLLYEFYFAIYDSFQKHSDFAKVLLMEQSQTLNKELFLKMRYYDKLFERNILSMIERLYGVTITETKYDLMFSIKGFMNHYSQLFVFFNVPLNLELLAESLVEKTNLLAQHAKIPFISKDLVQILEPVNEDVSVERMVNMIEEITEEMGESIEKESLIEIKKQLVEPPTYSKAIMKGLLENIRNHPHCKWIAYLLRKHFQL